MNVFHTKARPQVLREGTDTFEPEAKSAKLHEMTIKISKALESCCCLRFYGSLMRSVLLLDGLQKTYPEVVMRKPCMFCGKVMSLYQSITSGAANQESTMNITVEARSCIRLWVDVHQIGLLFVLATGSIKYLHTKGNEIFISDFIQLRQDCFCYATICSRLAGETHHCRWWAA